LRQRFECIGCGLILQGRITRDGTIQPYDRAPSDWTKATVPCICSHCTEYPTEQLKRVRAQEAKQP
jgi:hypothetical protein